MVAIGLGLNLALRAPLLFQAGTSPAVTPLLFAQADPVSSTGTTARPADDSREGWAGAAALLPVLAVSAGVVVAGSGAFPLNCDDRGCTGSALGRAVFWNVGLFALTPMVATGVAALVWGDSRGIGRAFARTFMFAGVATLVSSGLEFLVATAISPAAMAFVAIAEFVVLSLGLPAVSASALAEASTASKPAGEGTVPPTSKIPAGTVGFRFAIP